MISILRPFSFKKSQPGFTLVEMMVVVAIFLIMTGVILINAPSVREKLSIELVAQELSINIRGTQVYGISTQGKIIIEDGVEKTIFPSYGIYFDLNNPKEAKIFALPIGDNDLAFDPVANSDAVAETYRIPEGYAIDSLNYFDEDGNKIPANKLVTAFIRPSPRARFAIGGEGENDAIQNVLITVKSIRESKARQITVYNNGQISVTDPSLEN